MQRSALPARDEQFHEPVLLEEVIELLDVQESGIYVDCTAGTGGHLAKIAELSGPNGFVLGFDLDAYALSICEKRLSKLSETKSIAHWQLENSSYTEIGSLTSALPGGFADGVLMDFGYSSLQMDNPDRGSRELPDS